MQATINSFTKGMNKDVSKTLLPQNNYIDALNIRILTSEGYSTGVVSNFKGNDFSFTFPTSNYNTAVSTEVNIIGYTTIRDILVLFTKETCQPARFNTDGVWLVFYNNETNKLFDLNKTEENAEFLIKYPWAYDTINNSTDKLGILKAYERIDLNFSLDNPIEAIGRYINDNTQKVYWTDNNNLFRNLNVVKTSSQTYPLQNSIYSLTMIPGANLERPLITKVDVGGSLLAGKIAYIYRLYHKDGGQTPFSPISNVVHLCVSRSFDSSSLLYNGSPLGTDTGKSCLIDINNIDTTYDSIEVCSVLYQNYDASPLINVVKRTNVPSNGKLSIIDNGETSFELLDLEVLNIQNKLFVSKTFVQKDTRLFHGNIKEDILDVDYDARAYRSNVNGGFYDYTDINGNSTTIDISNWDSIPESSDVINTDQYNFKYKGNSNKFGGLGPNVSYEFYTHKTTGNNAGYSGLTFTTAKTQAPIYDNNFSSDDFVSNYGYTDYANPLSEQTVSYQRDEVYRFGIVFRDGYGRKSYVKWIGDIKMPAIWEADEFKLTSQVGETVYFHILGVRFFVTRIPIDQTTGNPYRYEIVRVKRSESDRSIRAQGWLVPTTNHCEWGNVNTQNDLGPLSVIGSISQYDWWDFNLYSPEISFNNKHNFEDGDTIQYLGKYDISTYSSSLNAYRENVVIANGSFYSQYGGNNYNIKQSDIIAPGGSVDVKDKPLTKFVNNVLSSRFKSPAPYLVSSQGGTTMFIQLPQTTGGGNISWLMSEYGTYGLLINNYCTYLFNYKRSVKNQYGGNTYVDRTRSTYITCSKIFDNTTATVFGGDTYINFFDCLELYKDLSATTPNILFKPLTVRMIPVESSVNTKLANDGGYSQHQTLLLQEDAIDASSLFTYVQRFSLYGYNAAYSQENDAISYVTKQFNWTENSTFDTRVLYSKNSRLGEEVDSWTIYESGGERDLDSVYGPINELKLLKSNVFFWQDYAFGTLAINPRAIVTTTAGFATSLGISNNVIEDHSYISNINGCKHRWSIVDTPNGLYWFDVSSRKIMSYMGEGVKPLTDIKGVHGFLLNNLRGKILSNDNPLNRMGVTSTFDNVNNEVLFTFLDTTTPLFDGLSPIYSGFTISYSEMVGAFTSFYSFTPRMYINDKKRILTSYCKVLSRTPKVFTNGIPENIYNEEGEIIYDNPIVQTPTDNNIYIHDSGLIGSYYWKEMDGGDDFEKMDNSINESRLTFVINENQLVGSGYESSKPYNYTLLTKVFDNSGIVMETMHGTDNNIHFQSEPLTKIRFSTDYQNTDYITLNPSTNCRNVEQEWRMAIGRNKVVSVSNNIYDPSNLNNLSEDGDRLRDKLMIVNAVYDNKLNRKIHLHYCKTLYRFSAR